MELPNLVAIFCSCIVYHHLNFEQCNSKLLLTFQVCKFWNLQMITSYEILFDEPFTICI